MYIFFLLHLGAHIQYFLTICGRERGKNRKISRPLGAGPSIGRWTFNQSKEGNLRGTCALTPENTIAALKSRFRRENSKKLLENFSHPAGAMTKSKKRIDLEGQGGLVSCPSEGEWSKREVRTKNSTAFNHKQEEKQFHERKTGIAGQCH